MSAAPLHCLLARRDDLHDFAEHWLNTATVMSLNAPLCLSKDFGGAVCGVLHQDGAYQVELITFNGGVCIPSHTHPGTDSIEFPLSGGVQFVVNGRALLHSADNSFLRRTKNQGLRINADDVHSGRVISVGAMFLSIQRWSSSLAHIGENYVGAAVSEKHKQAMGSYAH